MKMLAFTIHGFQSQGLYNVKLDVYYQPSGLYVYRLEADGFSASKKMFLQK